MDINNQAKILQKALAIIDHKTTKVPEGFMGLVLLRLEPLKLIMRREPNHNLPHLHVIYKKTEESSYSIKDGTKLAGKSNRKYEKTIMEWITENKSDLLKIWDDIQEGEGKIATHLIAEIQGNN